MGSLPETYNDLYCLGRREVGGKGRLAFCLEFAKLQEGNFVKAMCLLLICLPVVGCLTGKTH